MQVTGDSVFGLPLAEYLGRTLLTSENGVER